MKPSLEEIRSMDLDNQYKKAEKNINFYIDLIKTDLNSNIGNNKIIEPIKSNDTFEEYKKKKDSLLKIQ